MWPGWEQGGEGCGWAAENWHINDADEDDDDYDYDDVEEKDGNKVGAGRLKIDKPLEEYGGGWFLWGFRQWE